MVAEGFKVSVYIAVSIDGFIARTDGDIDWLHSYSESDENEDYGYKEFMSSVDALIMGRKTFEKVVSFGKWPYENKMVVVLSSSSVTIPEKLGKHIEVSSLDPSELLANLSKRDINHVYVDGGKTIQSFLCAGLVNEFIITYIPRLIGNGIPLFGTLEQDILLKHIYTKSYSSGLAQSKYEVLQSTV